MNIKKICIKVFLGIIVVIVIMWSLFPLVYLTIISFAGPGTLPTSIHLPERLSLINWQTLLIEEPIWSCMWNSLIVGGITAAITLLVIIPASYTFSRFPSRINNTIFVMQLFFRMVPPMCLMLPLFLMLKSYGLLGTRIGLSLAHLIITVPLAVWLMKGYFDMVPREIEEAAVVDGANRFQVLAVITLPLAKPGIAVTALFSFWFSYINYLFALIITRGPTTTLPIYIAGYMGVHRTFWRLIGCSTLLSLIPSIAFFIFIQPYLARGLTLGAVK